MTEILQSIRLTERQTNNILNRATYAPDTYLVPMLIEGNSLFSSVWVQSMDAGASLTVRYFETTSGNMGDERVDIVSHQVITPGMLNPTYGITNQVTVTPFHNKPVCEILLTGGSAHFGIYATVVDTFASDLDAALVMDGQVANLAQDKAIPIAGYDESGQFRIFRFRNDRLLVETEIVSTGQPFHLAGSASSVPSSTWTSILSYTVPAGKSLTLQRIAVGGENIATFEAYNGAVLLGTKRTYFGGSLDTSFEFSDSVTILEGETVSVRVQHGRPSIADFDAYFVGRIEDI